MLNGNLVKVYTLLLGFRREVLLLLEQEILQTKPYLKMLNPPPQQPPCYLILFLQVVNIP
uniref:Uncharacterized protein n=1 Tax=Arundo donax TaxID=35708 RepID=A0A0A8ZK79_ARUDO